MDTYGITSNAVFNPISLERMEQPFVEYNNEVNSRLNELTDLQQKANILEIMAGEDKDTKAYAMYKNYMNNLELASNALITKGLVRGATRADLSRLKSDYTKQITPLEAAFNIRKQKTDEYNKGIASGLMYDKRPDDYTLDAFLDDPNWNSKSANFNDSYKKVSDEIKEFSQKIRDYKKGEKKVDPWLISLIEQYGYAPEDVPDIIDETYNFLTGASNQISDNNPFAKMLYNEMKQKGVYEWENRNSISKYAAGLSEAINHAIGKEAVNFRENIGMREAAANARTQKPQEPVNPEVTTRTIASPEDVNKQYHEWVNYKDYFNELPSGEIKLTDKALRNLDSDEAFRNGLDLESRIFEKDGKYYIKRKPIHANPLHANPLHANPYVTTYMPPVMIRVHKTEDGRWVENTNFYNFIEDKLDGDINNWKAFAKAAEEGYDASQTYYIYKDVALKDSDEMKYKLMSHYIGRETVPTYEYEKGKWKIKNVDFDDIFNDDNKVAYLGVDANLDDNGVDNKEVIFLNMINKDENKNIRVKLNSFVDQATYDYIKQNAISAKMISRDLKEFNKTGKILLRDENNNVVTDENGNLKYQELTDEEAMIYRKRMTEKAKQFQQEAFNKLSNYLYFYGIKNETSNYQPIPGN